MTSDDAGDIWLNDDVFIANVPKVAWRCELGGYQVIKKWLGYRHESRIAGRPIGLDEQRWLRSMILRLTALARLESALDSLYADAAEAALPMQSFAEAVHAAE